MKRHYIKAPTRDARIAGCEYFNIKLIWILRNVKTVRYYYSINSADVWSATTCRIAQLRGNQLSKWVRVPPNQRARARRCADGCWTRLLVFMTRQNGAISFSDRRVPVSVAFRSCRRGQRLTAFRGLFWRCYAVPSARRDKTKWKKSTTLNPIQVNKGWIQTDSQMCCIFI